MKRWMGIDYGDRHIGIAVSDELFITAQGLTTLHHSGEEAVIREIEQLANKWNVTEVIVGLPRNMNGSIGPRGRIAETFAESLQEKLNRPVHLWDERLTTVSAERMLLAADLSRKKRKQVIDKMAATLLLQNYMDAKLTKG
jgi:putative Holliday junction resolvase